MTADQDETTESETIASETTVPEAPAPEITVSENPGLPPPEPLSDVPFDALEIKKRGFLLTLNATPDALLEEAENKIVARYQTILSEVGVQKKHRLEHLQEQYVRLQEKLTELKGKKEAYGLEVKNLKQELPGIAAELEKIQAEIQVKLELLGKEKAGIVKTMLAHLQEEITEALSIYRQVQKEQNKELEAEYHRDKVVFEKKIKFWEKIRDGYQEQYDGVAARLRLLARDGINPAMAKFLLYLGGVSALVSGWWFSLWAGPGNSGGQHASISGNTSVNFFLVDNIARYLSAMGPWKMLLLVLFYVGTAGVLSWLCHLLLIKFGFVLDVKALRKKKAENDDDRDEFRIQEDKLLQLRIRSTSWWGLWLKIAPAIFCILPLLGLINTQVSQDSNAQKLAGKGNPPLTFQGLFDAEINQLMGTMMAVMFSVFVILFLTRIAENRYHARSSAANEDTARPLPVFYIGFLLFALMILAMFLYHYPIPFFDDIRRIALFGFITSCLATGFSLAYGYIFGGLKNNSDTLLFYIDAVTGFIQQLSKPYQVNYTTNRRLRDRLYRFQQKVMNLIEGRHNLANRVAASGHAEDIGETDNWDAAPPKDGKAMVYRAALSFYSRYRHRLYNWFWRRRRRNAFDRQVMDASGINQDDLDYFPEISLQLAHLRQQLLPLEARRLNIQGTEESHLRNEGTTGHLQQQLDNLAAAILQLGETSVGIDLEYQREAELIVLRRESEITLLREGFHTGLWFKKFNWNKSL
jgi:hypothetical protein